MEFITFVKEPRFEESLLRSGISLPVCSFQIIDCLLPADEFMHERAVSDVTLLRGMSAYLRKYVFEIFRSFLDPIHNH
jgi:hypothetical protein